MLARTVTLIIILITALIFAGLGLAIRSGKKKIKDKLKFPKL